VTAVLARRAIEIRAARIETNLVLARHVHRTIAIVATRKRAHAATAFLGLSATEADAALRARSTRATEAAAAAVRIEAALIEVARVIVATSEQAYGE
jgi:hypothetical protein